MKKIVKPFLFSVVIVFSLCLVNCNHKSPEHTEQAVTDTVEVSASPSNKSEPPVAETGTEWEIKVVAETAGGAPIAGVTARLKKMPGDNECTYDQTLVTDTAGIAKFTGTGSCPCKKFKAGVVTDNCNKSKTDVVCGETVTFVCP